MRTLILLVLTLGTLSIPSQASSAVECHSVEVTKPGPGGTIITVIEQVCEDTGTGGSEGPGSGGGGCSFDGRKIPCTKDGLTWIASHACYAMDVSEWFEPGAPEWQGHTEGSLWNCMGQGPDQLPGIDEIFWLPNGEEPPPPDPRELAEQVFGEMQLATPDVHTAPAPPLKTYVGLDTWLWMDQGQWRTLTNSVAVRDTTVNVTARVVSARWDMGSGSVGCPSAGRPWVKGMSDSVTTDCSYTYTKVSDFEPGKKFKISVHLEYQVDWTCSGECLVDDGTLGINNGPSAGSAIRVGERQSVVIGRTG